MITNALAIPLGLYLSFGLFAPHSAFCCATTDIDEGCMLTAVKKELLHRINLNS